MALDDVRTRQRDSAVTLRSETPTGVRQESYGLLVAHNPVRVELAHVAVAGADSSEPGQPRGARATHGQDVPSGDDDARGALRAEGTLPRVAGVRQPGEPPQHRADALQLCPAHASVREVHQVEYGGDVRRTPERDPEVGVRRAGG